MKKTLLTAIAIGLLAGMTAVNAGVPKQPTTPVPDAGSSLVLLGVGMLGLGALRRRLS